MGLKFYTQKVYQRAKNFPKPLFLFFDFFQNGGHFYTKSGVFAGFFRGNGRHFEKNQKIKKVAFGGFLPSGILFVYKISAP